MNETHERLWHEWYGLWHGADASKPKPGYEEWLEARIEELEVAAQQVAEADASTARERDAMNYNAGGVETDDD